MLSTNLEITLKHALAIATKHKHEYTTYEHLLLALIEDKDILGVLTYNKIDAKNIAKKLSNYLKHDLLDLVNDQVKESKPTSGFQRIIQRAAVHCQANGQKIINGIDILAEFFFENSSYALICLKEANLTRQDILNHKANNKDESLHKKQEYLSDLKNYEKEQKPDQKDLFENELEKYCVNLNEKAKDDDIDCLIGRQNEIQRTIEILCRRKKNNAILVGEPGVGKTAIAEGLALRIEKNDVPDLLKNTIIYSLDIGSLLAGTKFRGDFEERIKNLLLALKKQQNAILFIDEIHTIIGAGSTTNGALDASNLLKPALAKGELRCIGSTTFKEFHNHFEQDMALVRRFQKIIVAEPDEETSMHILQGLKGYYEKHHKVVYTDEALRAAINLSERYVHDRHLPDKAIDLIDEAGARSKLGKASRKPIIITDRHIEDLITSILNLPSLSISTDGIDQLKTLEHTLKANIFGQDEAITSLCTSIKLSKAGLKKGSRPTGCYLFAGPTGVGKTELAKQLAKLCNMKLLKFDMSEFSESSSVSKLLGSAPGYVGHEQGGMLTGEVDKYSYSVVLFDEIEKAHHDIYNLLLQIMDEGKITDSTGKSINFSNTIIILTTNIVAKQAKPSIGFNNEKDSKLPLDMSELKAHFSPEFRNRLDKIILFNPISQIVEKILDKNIKELATQLADKKVLLYVDQNVKKYFIDNFFNEENGARGLDRVIDSEIKQFIADEILFGHLKDGGVANVNFSTELQKIIFKFSASNKPKELELN